MDEVEVKCYRCGQKEQVDVEEYTGEDLRRLFGPYGFLCGNCQHADDMAAYSGCTV